jgi:hypothetical protein
VAFWGSGAAEWIRDAGGRVAEAQILCDISMGGCWPDALKGLGAPDNERLRRRDGLHAKVYISHAGLVVGSPNVSANGIGFGERDPVLLEAGSFYPPKSHAWKQAGAWFDSVYRDAKVVDDAALAEAQKRWQPKLGQKIVPIRDGSLLDLVRANPDQFGTIGFVFVDVAPTKEEREKALRNLKKQASATAKAIDALPNGGFFTGWETAELRRWPTVFIEFWASPRGQVYVFGRQVQFFEWATGSVFSTRSWPAARSQFPANVPTATNIARADADIVRKLLTTGGVLYSSAIELSKALIGL